MPLVILIVTIVGAVVTVRYLARVGRGLAAAGDDAPPIPTTQTTGCPCSGSGCSCA